MAGDTYKYLARYYDHFFEYRRPFERARQTMVEPLLPDVRTACDLCCGTGTWALELASRGIRMHAVDLSPDMCRMARRKARESGLAMQVQQADMRAFRLPEPVDLITCEFDAINHLPAKQDLIKVLRAASRALNPGGHLVFDLNNRAAFEDVWTTTVVAEKDPVLLIMRNGHLPGTDHAWSDIDWFIRKGRRWERRSERVEEVCWRPAEVRAALRQAGFHRILARDAAPFFDDHFTQPGYRTFWRARKA